MANNDIHYIRRELDQLQLRMKDFDVRTEYALSNSDTTPPPNDAEWSTEKPAPEEGKFIWARNIMNMGYGDVITEAYCIGDGQEHILSIDVEYLAWNSPYRQDGDGMEDSPYWQTVAPSILPNQYIWTRSVIETTNGTNYTSPVRITGLKGEKGQDGTNGIDGKAGKDGKGLEFIFKRLSTKVDNWNNPPSGVINPATLDPVPTDDHVPTGWTDDQEEVTEALPFQYVSIRTKTIATGQTTGEWQRFNTPRLWSVYGEKPYCHIRYADVNNPTNWNQTFANPQTSGATGISYHKYEGYLWNADETLKDADKDPTKFSWRIYRPTIGVAGEEGSFLHIAYADDEQGTGFNQYEGAYMGTCITWEETDPDDPSLYNWVKIEGNGIDYIEEQYALHTSYSTAPTTGWQSTKPTYVLGKYYWTRSVIHYTDGTSEQSAPMCVTGLDGTGINNVFYCTDSLSTPNTPSWSDIHDKSSTPSQNYNKWIHDPVDITSTYRYIYISTSTTHVYTNGVKSWTNFSAPVLWGRYALDGSSITNIVNYYASTTTATAPAKTSSVWKTNVSQVTFNSTYKYLWNYEETKSGNVVITSTTPVTIAYYSTDGAKGDAGKGIVSIVEYYAVNDGTTAPADSSFSTNVVNTTPQNPYLWNYEVINFTEGDPYKSSKRIIGTHGKSGDNGTGYEYAYYTSNSATAPTKPTGNVTATSGKGKWTKVPVPMTSTYKYMYISYRTIVGTTKSAWSNSALWSQFGDKGDTGDRGVDGKGLEHIFYRSNTKITWGNNNTNPAYWNAKQEDDYYGQDISGNQWTDDAQGVDKDHKYEYCAIRTKTPNSSGVGQWSKFNTPVLQNIYSAPITSITNYYLATSSSSGVTPSTSGWTTTVQTMTSTKQYLWNYEVIKDIDGTTVNTTTPCIIGRYGQNGSAGKGISSITEYYAVNNDKDNAPADNSFSTNVVTTTTSKKYLWNYEVITFSDSSTPYKSAKRIISTHGATGQNGSDGADGFGIYRIFSTITINTWSSASYPTGRYITAKSPIETELGTTLVAGDHIIYGDYMYEVIVVSGTNYGLSDRTELKGDQGETGIDGNNVSPSIILDKSTDNNLATTTVGGISNQIASDYVSSELKSQTITTYSYKFDDGKEHYAYFYKQGRLVTVNYNLMVRDSITTTYTTIFNVPSWAVPVNSIYILNIMAHFNYYRGQITSSGEFKLGSNNPTGGDGTQGVNVAGSVTYLAKDGIDLKEMNLSFPSTTVEQGNVLTARITPPSGVELPTAIPIYYRINGVVYKRMATPIGAGSYADAKLNINLGMDNTSTTTKKYPVSIWYDGGSYDNGYYQGISGEYGQKQATQNITVKKCTNPVITFGKESSYRCWVRVMNSTYAPLRYHDVIISYNGHSFVGNTDGNGYVYFNLENYVGKSVSVTATISNSTRCTAITSTGNITP